MTSSPSNAERVFDAVLHLTMAGSASSTDEVVIDHAEVAHVAGLPRDVVDAALADLMDSGTVDAC